MEDDKLLQDLKNTKEELAKVRVILNNLKDKLMDAELDAALYKSHHEYERTICYTEVKLGYFERIWYAILRGSVTNHIRGL